MTKWDWRYLELAREVAWWSKDPDRKVGAVVTDADNRVLSVGYNGFLAGENDCPLIYADREEKHRRIVHAERNALTYAGGCAHTLYVWPCMPCAPCAAAAVEAGVRRLVTLASYGPSHWQADWEAARGLFRDAGIECAVHGWDERPDDEAALPCGRCDICARGKA